jgi:glycosyltransferase involved in cell wall biosynthesis
MKILIISAKNKTVFNFRGDLIKDMISHGNEVYVTGPNKDYLEDVMALGIKKFIEIPFVKDNTSVKNDLNYLKQLKKTVKEVQPDIVFSYNIKPVVYGSMAAKAGNVPHIFAMVTGLGRVYGKGGLKNKILRLITKMLYKKAFKACNKVMFQNGDDVEDLVKEGYLPKEKTAIVNGSGVNLDRFKKSEIPETPVFLMVSRIIKEKGVLEFCEAARKLRKSHPEAKCILLGGFDSSIGALKPENIQGYIDDCSIVHPGEVKDPVAFYAKASVFVLPSYYREGLPRTILEALACGRPVITTDWTGCREAIVDDVNGYLVPIKDSNVLAEKMLKLCDRNKVLKMSYAAYRICKEKYEVSIINKQMREIIGYQKMENVK